MAIDTNAGFVDALRQSGLLTLEQLNELNRNLVPRYPDAKALAAQLIQLGWLTPYQVNQFFQGQASTLVLGQYRILERLGEGGMGQVFKARHNALGRVVALKVIRKDRLGNAEAVKRFRREMQIAGQLAHLNVVNAFDADTINGTHFFAMEYVDGTDLARRVREKGPLACHRACECIRQAALGLQHAHEKGMVHRDIKPSNLLVSKAPGTPSGVVIKILDMGLARFQASEQEETTMLSQDGHVIGTPDFMAPEQAKSSSTVDHRADIYSLGCTFYYLLTGKPPFTGGTNIEKLLKHQMDPPPPIEKLRPDVPEGVRLLLQQMLAKRPEERVQTAGAVALALEPYCKPGTAVVNGDRITPRPTSRVPFATANTPADTNALTIASRGPRSGRLPVISQSFRRMNPRKRLMAIGIGAGVGLLGVFILVLMLASGGSSPKTTSPAMASTPVPLPSTRVSPPTTDKKPPPPQPELAWRFLFPETTVVVSFNMAQIRKSEVYRQHEQPLKGLLQPLLGQWDVFGDGFMAGADRFTVAFPGNDSQRQLLIVQGQLDVRRFKNFANRLGAKAFTPKDSTLEVYDLRDPERNAHWIATFVTPNTFLMSTNMGYVVGGGRGFLQNNIRPVRDTLVQNAVERLDENASVVVVMGGQLVMATPNPNEKSTTLQDGYGIKLVRGSLRIANGVAADFQFVAEDAAAVEHVENFPGMIKTSFRTGNKELGDLLDSMFSEKPQRGPNNTVSIRGVLNLKQVGRVFEILARKS
jgi:serine/threonine protein kinase